MRERLSGFYYQLLRLSVFLLFSQISLAQDINVLDEKGEGLPYTLIYNPDQSLSIYTDEFGMANLKNPDLFDTLIFEHLGFEALQISIHDIRLMDFIVQMKPQTELLDEVLVIGRTDRKAREVIGQTTRLTSRDFQLENPQTTADAMTKSGQIFVQKSQMGGGSPVLRGFEANRVLLVVDGIRMNNAIYRNGHLHNAISIDPAMLESIELIFGPGSLSYGTDALGGVIHFRSKHPKFKYNQKNKSNTINYKARYSSANNEKSGHLRWGLELKNVAFLTGISYSDFGDLRAGSKRPAAYPEFGKRLNFVKNQDGSDQLLNNENENLQIGTAYKQVDVFQKARFRLGEGIELSSNLQYSSSSNVPRYDFLTEKEDDGLRYAEWYYGPQNRFLASLSLKANLNALFFDKAILIAATQRIDEDRYNRRFASEDLLATIEDLWVHSFTADLVKSFNKINKVDYGVDLQFNDLTSRGYSENVINGAIREDVFSRYPDALARQLNYGTYFNYTLDLSKIQLQTGIRFSRNELDIAFSENSPIIWPTYFYSGIENNTNAFAYSIGAKYNLADYAKYRIVFSSAFRTPNIDDLAKIRVKNDEMLIPNPDLIPEQAFNLELGADHNFELFGFKHTFKTVAFSTLLENGILRENYTLPDGSDYYISGMDTLAIQANVNADRLNIWGLYFGLSGHLDSKMNYGIQFNFTRGRVLNGSDTKPAGHIPPMYGNAWIGYTNKKLTLKLSSVFNGNKAIDEYGGSVDNPQSATIDGAYSWFILNLHAAYNISDQLSLNFGVENMLDTHYRPFSSGVSAPGINAIIGIQGSF